MRDTKKRINTNSFLTVSNFVFYAEKQRGMQNKPRTIPAALDLSPEVNLLKEFAVIATSPQSPLVQEVSGESMVVRCSDGDIPPPQLTNPKQMVCRLH